jgi:PadR family transcriptional regulator PadR
MVSSEMREPTFLVLAALAAGRKHGYALTAQIREDSGGRVVLRAGTLYAALDRLTAEGLVVEAGEEVVGGRLRRYYDLSEEGVEALTVETRRLQENVRRARRGLRLRGVTA